MWLQVEKQDGSALPVCKDDVCAPERTPTLNDPTMEHLMSVCGTIYRRPYLSLHAPIKT